MGRAALPGRASTPWRDGSLGRFVFWLLADRWLLYSFFLSRAAFCLSNFSSVKINQILTHTNLFCSFYFSSAGDSLLQFLI
jgi:hypothetical protein